MKPPPSRAASPSSSSPHHRHPPKEQPDQQTSSSSTTPFAAASSPISNQDPTDSQTSNLDSGSQVPMTDLSQSHSSDSDDNSNKEEGEEDEGSGEAGVDYPHGATYGMPRRPSNGDETLDGGEDEADEEHDEDDNVDVREQEDDEEEEEVDEESPEPETKVKDGELVLSDVHIHPSHGSEPGRQDMRITFFKARVGPLTVGGDLTTEERGEPAAKRRRINDDAQERKSEQGGGTIEYRIYHRLATPLKGVGCQVWSGAILLSDFLLHHASSFRNRTLLEIGAGTGLVSIVAASAPVGARRVFATDLIHRSRNRSVQRTTAAAVGEQSWDVLKLCEDNLKANSVTNVVRVRELNVEHEHGPVFRSLVAAVSSSSSSSSSSSAPSSTTNKVQDDSYLLVEDDDAGENVCHPSTSSANLKENLAAYNDPDDPFSKYAWTSEDLEEFHEDCDVILGADIIYIDKVTFHLVKRLWSLLRRRRYFTTPTKSGTEHVKKPTPFPTLPNPPEFSRVMYLSIEKRIQFTWNTRNIRAPAWDFFLDTVEALNADRADSEGLEMVLEQVDISDLPQRFYSSSEDDDGDAGEGGVEGTGVGRSTRVKELEIWRAYLRAINICPKNAFDSSNSHDNDNEKMTVDIPAPNTTDEQQLIHVDAVTDTNSTVAELKKSLTATSATNIAAVADVVKTPQAAAAAAAELAKAAEPEAVDEEMMEDVEDEEEDEEGEEELDDEQLEMEMDGEEDLDEDIQHLDASAILPRRTRGKQLSMTDEERVEMCVDDDHDEDFVAIEEDEEVEH
ncbi:Methyltransferase-like protein 22 [Chytridiales sp. JEL 0842]|nr:Methyltransferase-like protein 22 [Chytridiales sp. JEL 0842]